MYESEWGILVVLIICICGPLNVDVQPGCVFRLLVFDLHLELLLASRHVEFILSNFVKKHVGDIMFVCIRIRL